MLLLGSSVTLIAQTTKLKVITINMRMSGEMVNYDMAPFVEFIRAENPDFVALQEVDYMTVRNKMQDVVTILGAELGMFPLFGRAMAYTSGSYGVGILSKYPFMNSKTIVVNPTGSREPRSCSFIDVKLPSGKVVRLGATHLDTSNSQVQISMVGKVVEVMNTQNLPNLLLGDFNAQPGGETINYCKIFWDDLSSESGLTFPYPNATSKIDFIMGYPKGAWSTKSIRTVRDGISFTDHCPIVAEVELK